MGQFQARLELAPHTSAYFRSNDFNFDGDILVLARAVPNEDVAVLLPEAGEFLASKSQPVALAGQRLE